MRQIVHSLGHLFSHLINDLLMNRLIKKVAYFTQAGTQIFDELNQIFDRFDHFRDAQVIKHLKKSH